MSDCLGMCLQIIDHGGYQLVPVPGVFVYIRSPGVKWC